MTKKNNISKCDKCLNGHKILSENGYHTNCSLDEALYIKCMLGTKNSYKCTLILTEEDSAKSLAMSGIEVIMFVFH